MTQLLNESLLVCDYFNAYHRELTRIARRTLARRVKSRKLDELYERLAVQVEKVKALRKMLVENN